MAHFSQSRALTADRPSAVVILLGGFTVTAKTVLELGLAVICDTLNGRLSAAEAKRLQKLIDAVVKGKEPPTALQDWAEKWIVDLSATVAGDGSKAPGEAKRGRKPRDG